MKTQKNVSQIVIAAAPHMVGDGFRVQSTLPGGTRSENNRISPFIMMDYSAPNYIPPAPQPKGVGEHPHKDSKQLLSYIRANWNTGILQAAMVNYFLVMCSG